MPPAANLTVSAAWKDTVSTSKLSIVARILPTTMLAVSLTMDLAMLTANNVPKDTFSLMENATPSPAAYKIVPTVSEVNPALSAMKGTRSITPRALVRPTTPAAHPTAWLARTGLAQNA